MVKNHLHVSCLLRLPSPSAGPGTNIGDPKPPTLHLLGEKKQKCWQRRQNVLRRFLATLPAIGCIYAPDFDHTNPQGVHSDSLGTFGSIGEAEVGEKLAVRALFERAASAIILYVL